MIDIPPTDRPFAYLTHAGEAVLVEEIAREVQAALAQGGVELDLPVITAILRALRHVTEAISQGDGAVSDDIPSRVQAVLRRDRVMLPAPLVEAALREALAQLRRADVAGVQYFSRPEAS